MTSKIIVNNIESDTGIASVTFTSKVNLSGGITGNFGSDNIGINTDNPIQTLDVRGEATFGEGITKADLDWGTDTNQRVYTFSGASDGGTNPADGVILLANPNTNPSNTRVGGIVFGNKVVGTANTSQNPGIKVAIEGRTNTNISTNADDTGGHININTKPDGGDIRAVAIFDSEGRVTKPDQPGFFARRSIAGDGRAAGAQEWSVTGSNSFNVGNHFNPSNGRFTAPVTGRYLFTAAPGYKQSSIDFNFYFRINGSNNSEPVRFIGALNSHSTGTGTIIWWIAAGDYVDIYVGYTHHVNTGLNFFMGYLLG